MRSYHLLVQDPAFNDEGTHLVGEPATNTDLPWYWAKTCIFSKPNKLGHRLAHPQALRKSMFLGSKVVVTTPAEAVATTYGTSAPNCRTCPPLLLKRPQPTGDELVQFRCMNPFHRDDPPHPLPVRRATPTTASPAVQAVLASRAAKAARLIPDRRGRPSRPFLVCDDPQPQPTPPETRPYTALVAPTSNPDPDRCWFWAGPAYVYAQRSLTKHNRIIQVGVRLPTHRRLPLALAAYEHFLPDHQVPQSLDPCTRTIRFCPFPPRQDLFLTCINPHHRFPHFPTIAHTTTSETISNSNSTTTPDPLSPPLPLPQLHHTRFYEDLFTAVPNPPDTIDELLALPPFHIPPEPPYTREEIVSHINEAHSDLALPPSWKKLHKP